VPWESDYVTNILLDRPCYYHKILISNDCRKCPLDECLFVLLDTPNTKVALETALKAIGIIGVSVIDRNDGIVNAKNQGMPTHKIMKMFNVSRTTVGRVIRQSRLSP